MDPFYQEPGRKSIRLEDAYEGEGEDETFLFDHDIVFEMEQLMDKDIDESLDKLTAEKDGPVTKKIREVPSINLFEMDRKKYFSSSMERVLHIKSCTYL